MLERQGGIGLRKGSHGGRKVECGVVLDSTGKLLAWKIRYGESDKEIRR